MNDIEILERFIKCTQDEKDILYKLDEETKRAIENLMNEYKYMHKELNLMQKGLIVKENKELKKQLNDIEILEELQEYANWHIEHLTENILDYIDDGKKENASIIGEFKEEREHWRDIIRIINNEKTYIDYKNLY